MLCERCKQREANIKYTEVINGVRTEHSLCSQCAKEIDFGGHYAAIIDGEFPLGRLISSLLGFQADSEEQEQKTRIEQITCPTCHTTYSNFVKQSRFGCPDCYSMFELLMGDHLKALHGSDTHVGKRPKYQKEGMKQEKQNSEKEDLNEQLDLLNSKLQEAIREEEYEMAAKYRDEMKALKERMKTDA